LLQHKVPQYEKKWCNEQICKTIDSDKKCKLTSTYITWTKENDVILRNLMDMNEGISLKTLAKKFISINLDLMFNIKKIVRHIQYMKSKQNSSRISWTKSLGNDEFPTPIILPITSNVLKHDNLMPQKQIMIISMKICKKTS
jgi:hypothetical protein